MASVSTGYLSSEGVLDVSITKSDLPFEFEVHATADTPIGQGQPQRGAFIPRSSSEECEDRPH